MVSAHTVLDIFSAAAGGWSLGMHRAGFRTIAACENVAWRRALYAQNNAGIPIYDDVCSLTADRLLRDIGDLPAVIVGSPPCQDISSANAKGKGVEGERSGLFFEAIRIVGECRPRWFALENSANLRTRGADAVCAELEALDYACWPLVVRASDIGANHERPRCWLIGCDIEQVADANGLGRAAGWSRGRVGIDLSASGDLGDTAEVGRRQGFPRGCPGATGGAEQPACGDAPHADRHGRCDGRGHDGQGIGQMGLRTPDHGGADSPWPLWSLADLAGRLRLDDGVPARLAGMRVAVGGPRGTSAASLIVEAYGDAVVPQIPEAIGRAILRVEQAMSAITRPRIGNNIEDVACDHPYS